MTGFKSDFLRTLSERGFIHQVSDESGLDDLFAKETVTAYVGYDATATSLHIGNLISATMLHWLQETGHRPIALMGGGLALGNAVESLGLLAVRNTHFRELFLNNISE